MSRDVKLKIALLDACRDNPLSRSLATKSRAIVVSGLADMKVTAQRVTDGSLIAFATEPGNTALDGDGQHSPFTQALLQDFDSNASLSSVMNRVTSDVQSVRACVDGVLIQLVILTLSLIGFMAYMLSIHVGLTFACLATTPLMWLVTAVFSRMVRPLYDRKAAADKQQLHEQSTLAETRWHDARQDLVQRVSEAYFAVLLAEETLAVGLAEKAAVGLQRDRAQARFDVGRGKITEVQ